MRRRQRETAGVRALVPPRARPEWSTVVAAGAVGVLVAVMVLSGTRAVNVNTGDTNALAAGARVAVECLADGTLRNCGGGIDVGSFGLLQYVPAIVLVVLGLGDSDVVRALAWLSLLALLALVAVVAGPARRELSPPAATVLMVAVVSGPLLLYALLPYGEALAAALGVAFLVLGCRRRSVVLIVILGALAMVSRETAVPFLLVAGLVCARRPEEGDGWLPPRRITAALIGSAVVAVASSALWNQFRFASFTNEANSVPWSRVPGLDLRARLAWALWGAPNVGIAWFWPAVTLILVGLVVAVVRQLRSHDLGRALPSGAVLGLAALMTGGLASWYSTFGWVAWGPRLSLGLLPVLAVAALVAGGDELTGVIRALARSAVGLGVVAAVVALLALPQAGVIWNGHAIALPLEPTPACPRLLPVTEAEPTYFYGCGLASAWNDDPYFLVEAARGRTPAKLVAQGAVVVAIGALALRLRRRRAPERRRAEPAARPSAAR